MSEKIGLSVQLAGRPRISRTEAARNEGRNYEILSNCHDILKDIFKREADILDFNSGRFAFTNAVDADKCTRDMSALCTTLESKLNKMHRKSGSRELAVFVNYNSLIVAETFSSDPDYERCL